MKVAECSINGGFWDPETLDIGFEVSDSVGTAWLNAIQDEITVNDNTYTRKSSLSSSDKGNYWCIGTFYGQQGRVTALRILNKNLSYPVTIKASADGYPDAIISVEMKKQGYSEYYVATITEDSSNPDPATYTITVSDSALNGTVSVDQDKAAAGATIKVTTSPADGYTLDQIVVTDGDGKSVDVSDDGEFTMPASDVTVSATFKQNSSEPGGDPTGLKEIKPEQIAVTEEEWFGNTWYFTVSGDSDYVGAITGIKVNGDAWTETGYISSGGSYLLRPSDSRFELARNDYSGRDSAIKSGDVILITADGYKDLELKFVVDKDGKASVVANDGQGDQYEIRVKIVGSFESAITGQDYDAVSGATGMAGSTTKYSDVTVYGALIQKGTEPTDEDWHELSHQASDSEIDLNNSKSVVAIVADTENGTSADSNSGMTGVYDYALSSELSLSGVAQDVGRYLISLSVTDEQGRTATSNQLPFRIYSGNERLADQMIVSNMRETQDGKYMWDIMEPWWIQQFGSNVAGENESVRVLEGVKAWYGSHTSGTYGYLGYDIPWKDVQDGNIPQTLYIPGGCNLTLVNMEILSSVRIVIEDGGQLTLRDSVVQGIIDVEAGGTFSMNYDDYSEQFLTGSSVCGQIRLQDGAILENAAIYSHANYLANGHLTDRTTTDPVVTATGNVTIKGDVYIEGDGAGRDCGQTGLLVKDGTLTVGDGSTLVVFGGESMNGWDGGTAIKLDKGTITGAGKLVAIGGQSGPVTGDGGDAVSGSGTIGTDETFLRGATAYDRTQPGQAVAGDGITIDSKSESIEDGVTKDLYGDPYEGYYWNTGNDPQPPLDQYVTDPVKRYTITVQNGANGTAVASASTAKAGTTITVTATPDDGYRLSALTVTDANGNTVATTPSRSRASQSSEFTMPAADVTIAATFVKEQSESEDSKGDSKGDSKPSGDDSKSDDNSSSSGSSHHGSSSGKSSQTGSAAGTGAAGANVTVNNAVTVDSTSGAESGHINATGDDAHMDLWMMIMTLGVAGLAGVTAYRRKR